MSPAKAAQYLAKRRQSDVSVVGDPRDAALAPCNPTAEVIKMPHNPQACLGGLPEELIAQIAEYLPVMSLGRFSQTDKRNKRIAYAALYSEIERGNWQKLKSVASNVELPKHVKVFRLEITSEDDKDIDMITDCHPVVLAQAVNLQEFLIFDNLPVYMKQLLRDAWLDILGGKGCSGHGKSINQFHNLKSLTIYSEDHSVGDMEAVFRLPALTRLLLVNACQAVPFQDWTVPESSSRIETLEIRQSLINSEALAQLLSYIEALNSFSYSHWGLLRGEASAKTTGFSWTIIGEALRLHHESLADLCMYSSDEEFCRKFPGVSGYGVVGSLRECRHLRSLTIPLHTLTNLTHGNETLSAFLPSSLKDLEMSLKHTEIDPQYPATAVDSLQDVFTGGSDCQLTIRLSKGSPYGLLQLSGPLQGLVNAGASIEIWHEGSLSKISIDKLRTMEVDGYEDPEESTDGEETGIDWDDTDWDYDGWDFSGEEDDDLWEESNSLDYGELWSM